MALDLDSVTCAECGATVDDTGYLPATETAEGYDPRPEAAVCGSCGFNEVGMMGCAPELDEVADQEAIDVLLYVQSTDDGVEVVSAKS